MAIQLEQVGRESKFVQIISHLGQIHALDENGRVWMLEWLVGAPSTWVPLTNHRESAIFEYRAEDDEKHPRDTF